VDPIQEARARRVAARAQVRLQWESLDHLRLARSYQDYVKDKKRRKEKPLSQPKWQSIQKGQEEPKGLKTPPTKSRFKHMLSRASGALKKALKGAPKETKRFIVDSEHRKKVTKAMGKSIRENGPKIAKALKENLKSEWKAIHTDVPKILHSLAKERRKPTKDELHTLYGVAVYAGGTALAALGAASASPLVVAGVAGKAFLHSITLHAAFKTMAATADEVFLGAEAAETMATGVAQAGLAGSLPVNTGQIPGIAQLWDLVGSAVKGIGTAAGIMAAEESDEDKALSAFLDKFLKNFAKTIEDLDDDDMKAVLEHGMAPPEKKKALHVEASPTDGKSTGDGTEWVGLFLPLPPEIAEQFPKLGGGDDKSPRHCTFLYVGDAQGRDEELVSACQEVLAQELHGPVQAKLEGVEHFVHPALERRVAVRTVRFGSDMAQVRDKIRERLIDLKFEVQDGFPLVYRPHVTLAYLDGLDNDYDGPVPSGEWTFNTIDVWGLPETAELTFGTHVPFGKVAEYFSPGDEVLFGKYKNKPGILKEIKKDERGVPTAVVEPNPKGRKKDKEIGLYKFWHKDKDKRAAADPFVGMSPELQEDFRRFTEYLTLWMGSGVLQVMSFSAREVGKIWRGSTELRRWLATHVNFPSYTLYYGGRLNHPQELPVVGDPFPRKGVLQWSTDESTSRWFAGLGNFHGPDSWDGGVLVQAQGGGANIIVDVDHFGSVCGQHQVSFAALMTKPDPVELFRKPAGEGEILTTGRVKGSVIQAEWFEDAHFQQAQQRAAARKLAGAWLRKKARGQVFDVNSIKKARKDFLMLFKNIARIQAGGTYKDLMGLTEAIKTWVTYFDDLIYKRLIDALKSGPQGEDSWFERQIRTKTWGFLSELRNRPEMMTSWEYLKRNEPWRQQEDLIREFREDPKGEVRKWVQRVRDKSRTAWKTLEEFISRYEFTKEEKFVVDIPSEDQAEIEGFQVRVVGLDGKGSRLLDDYTTKAFGRFKEGLRILRQKAPERFPWILKHMLPIEWRADGGLGEGGKYMRDHIVLFATGWEPHEYARATAHEMGHHVFQSFLSTADQRFWGEAIRQDWGPLDLRDVVQKWGHLDGSLGMSEEVREKDPRLYLQMQTLWHNPGYEYTRLDRIAHIQKYLDSGEDPIVIVPTQPISGYAGKNVEESFCEAVGQIVIYGPRTVPEQIRQWLDTILPGIKITGGAQRLAALYQEWAVKRVAGRA